MLPLGVKGAYAPGKRYLYVLNIKDYNLNQIFHQSHTENVFDKLN